MGNDLVNGVNMTNRPVIIDKRSLYKHSSEHTKSLENVFFFLFVSIFLLILDFETLRGSGTLKGLSE